MFMEIVNMFELMHYYGISLQLKATQREDPDYQQYANVHAKRY